MTAPRPIVTTIAELEAAVRSVYDDETVAAEAFEAGELARDLAGGSIEAGIEAVCEAFSRIIDQRFDFRLSDELVQQRIAAFDAARLAGISTRSQ
jgi:hypothetical protein